MFPNFAGLMLFYLHLKVNENVIDDDNLKRCHRVWQTLKAVGSQRTAKYVELLEKYYPGFVMSDIRAFIRK